MPKFKLVFDQTATVTYLVEGVDVKSGWELYNRTGPPGFGPSYTNQVECELVGVVMEEKPQLDKRRPRLLD